jgi:DGQHR domain-containing protein
LKYPCIIFRQKPGEELAPSFCMFEAPAEEIEAWSTVPRLSPEDASGIQRAKNDFKVKSISKFLQEDSRNTIPTAIVITLAEGAYRIETSGGQNSLGHICVEPENKQNIFVVDGQHRLYGLKLYNGQARVPVVAILDASNEEKAFQFIVINNKVSKVATDHIRALSINFTDQEDNQGLEQRLRTARLSLNRNVGYVGFADETPDSPFHGRVNLPGRPDSVERIIVPAAIEASIAFIQSKRFKQLSDEDAAYEFFIAMWASIKSKWDRGFSKDSKLLSKVGLVTMTRYITEALDSLATYGGQSLNFGNAEDVGKAIERILGLQSEDFWLSDWTIAVSDTKAVRDQVESALKTIQQNMRDKEPWHQDVALVKMETAS